jgi:hypothetical protein
MDEAASLLLTVEVDDSDAEEVDDLTQNLLEEIRRGSDVEAAGLARTDHLPPGAKGTATEIGTVIVQTLPAALPGLLALLRGWLERPRDRHVKVALKLAHGGSVNVEYSAGSMTQHDLLELIEAVRSQGRR